MADREPPQGGGSRIEPPTGVAARRQSPLSPGGSVLAACKASWRTLTRAGHMKRGCDWCRARFQNGDRITTLSKSVDLRFHYACGMEYLSRLAVHTERASPWPRRDPAANVIPQSRGEA